MRSFVRGLVALFLLGLLLASCGGGPTSPSASTSTAPSSASPSLPPSPAVGVNTQQLVVQLNPLNNSGVAGTATLRPGTNGTSVDLELLSPSPAAASPITSPLVGVTHPAGIYQGTCTQHNPTPAYPLNAATYEGPTPGSKSTVNVPLSKLTSQNYAIVIQKSPTDTTAVSCGVIQTSGLPVSPVPGGSPFS